MLYYLIHLTLLISFEPSNCPFTNRTNTTTRLNTPSSKNVEVSFVSESKLQQESTLYLVPSWSLPLLSLYEVVAVCFVSFEIVMIFFLRRKDVND
jgi:hypothetical protein